MKRNRLNPVKNFRRVGYKKYSNRSQVCHQNHKHDSVAEASYCDTLALLLKAKEIKSYRTQVTYDLTVNGKRVTGHRIDFEVEKNDGSIEVHEYKGFATPVWLLKRKLFIALYPNIPYITITR